MMSQSEIDTKNTEFWDELCGSRLARSLGISIESQNFDNLAFLKGRLVILREKLLSNFARVAGLDLYIEAYR